MKVAVALVHVFFATVWLGSAFFYTVLLLPRLPLVEAATRRVLTRSLRRAIVPLLGASAAVTIVSGLAMMVQLHPQHPGSLSHSRWGVALVIGTLASLGALAVAVVVESRLRKADAERRPDRTPTSTRREARVRLAALILLIVALATMVVARYS